VAFRVLREVGDKNVQTDFRTIRRIPEFLSSLGISECSFSVLRSRPRNRGLRDPFWLGAITDSPLFKQTDGGFI
jgi:hypothetical protein